MFFSENNIYRNYCVIIGSLSTRSFTIFLQLYDKFSTKVLINCLILLWSLQSLLIFLPYWLKDKIHLIPVVLLMLRKKKKEKEFGRRLRDSNRILTQLEWLSCNYMNVDLFSWFSTSWKCLEPSNLGTE